MAQLGLDTEEQLPTAPCNEALGVATSHVEQSQARGSGPGVCL